MQYNNNDLKKFAMILIERLEFINEIVLANDLKTWNETFFTTSTEFLGEFKMILEKIKLETTLDDVTLKDIDNCIREINKAFGN